ncbi:MAG: peptidylprolyl isomerase [Polyangiaceae bacterium]
MRRASLSLVLAALAAVAGCDTPAPAPTETTTASAAAPAQAPLSSAQKLAPTEERPTAQAVEAPPEIIAAQHVLVAYKGAKRAPASVSRSKADAKKRAEEALEKARKGEDFSALVKEYSDEPGAADRLGSLGKFKHEAMVKPFADAAFALKVNGVSDVVETEFGFHVIKRNQ